jgi:hypothetical protein
LRIELLLWALLMPLGWWALATVPAELAGAQGSIAGLLCLGFVVSTAVAVAFERRTLLGRLLPLSWRPARLGLVPAALLAGAGMLVLGSEIGNVVLSVWPRVVQAPAEAGAPDPLWARLALDGLVLPACSTVVFGVLVARAMAVVVGRRGAVIVAAGAAALLIGLPDPQSMPQTALMFGLAAWIYTLTGSPWITLAAATPAGVMNVLMTLGRGPGLIGFDLMPEGVVFQPIWLDLGGAVCIALGVGWLMRAFEGRPAAGAPNA